MVWDSVCTYVCTYIVCLPITYILETCDEGFGT